MNDSELDKITEQKRNHLRPLRLFNTFGMILRNNILVETKLVLRAEYACRRVDYDWSPVNEYLDLSNWNLIKDETTIIANSLIKFGN